MRRPTACDRDRSVAVRPHGFFRGGNYLASILKMSVVVLTYSFTIQTATADLRLPAIISDHAMIQAGKPVAIWGWAKPEARVKVAFVGNGSSPANGFEVLSDGSGKWSGHLPAMEAGMAGQLQISSDKDAPETVNDVLVGEVWLGGGQSNMDYRISGKGGSGGLDLENPEEVEQTAQNLTIAQKEADAATPPIRYFEVTSPGADQPMDDIKGSWVLGDSKNVGTFSAVAWNFAVAVQNKTHLPVGLVVSCKGGTPVEAWMSKEALNANPAGAAVLDRHNKKLAEMTPQKVAQLQADMKAWIATNPTNWRLRLGKKPAIPYTTAFWGVPVRLYNGMIHGLQPYTLRGIIWYQADGNMGNPQEYSDLFQGLIKQWRAEWKEQLPFYFVGLNNMWGENATRPVNNNPVCILREQQYGGLKQPATGIAGAIDVGSATNPHFPNKKPVGERLAGLALRDVYNQPGQVNSPMFQSFTVEANKVRLKFTDAGGLRIRGGGALTGFAIRSGTGDWVWATGKIEGQDIVVWNDQIPAPAAVRYAWAPNPPISVENGAGLPLLPFRTDTDSKE